jgi:hypothetical protein
MKVILNYLPLLSFKIEFDFKNIEMQLMNICCFEFEFKFEKTEMQFSMKLLINKLDKKVIRI